MIKDDVFQFLIKDDIYCNFSNSYFTKEHFLSFDQ